MSGTGATPAQIQRAAISAVERLGKFRYPSWEESPPAYQRQWIEDIEMRARYLVRPDERINPVADLIALCDAADQHLAYLRDGGPTTADQADALSATVDRVRAVIGGAE